jgi:MbtH protein
MLVEEAAVTNPFEDENGVYHVLVNEEGQHSLWPSFIDVPAGWTIIHASDTRAACLEFINRNWTDMRPKSLIERMNEQSAASEQTKEHPFSAAEGDHATLH